MSKNKKKQRSELMLVLDCYDEILSIDELYGKHKDKKEDWALKYINMLVKRTMKTLNSMDVTNCLILTLNLFLRDTEALDDYTKRGKGQEQLSGEEYERLKQILKTEFYC